MSKLLRTATQNSSDFDSGRNIQMRVRSMPLGGGDPRGGALQSISLRGVMREEGGFRRYMRRRWGLLWVFLGYWCVERGLRIWNDPQSRCERDESVTDVTVVA